ncbi:MAG: AraC family transcriptional regulator [Pirellulales bacterium]|nr:AraC family transcriptional regulator [Pirellulales bacterium]
MRIDLFDAQILAPLVRFLESNGVRSEAFLDRARIPGELIQGGGWITKKQAYDFTFDVVQRSRRADAVYAAYSQFELRHLGPIEAAMWRCKTVKEALETCALLGNAAYEGNEYFLRSDGDTTWFCYREPQSASLGQMFIPDMTLTVYHRLVCALVDDDWRPSQLLLCGELSERHRGIETFRDCQVRVHPHDTALGFPTGFLSRRLPAFKVSEHGAWISAPADCAPVFDSLYRLVASRFTYRLLPTLNHVARIVGVSPATLKRALWAEGTTYQGLLDRLRFDTACEMLAIPQMKLDEIAHELGYFGTNNFVRSFRRMTGLTPGNYRRKILSG